MGKNQGQWSWIWDAIADLSLCNQKVKDAMMDFDMEIVPLFDFWQAEKEKVSCFFHNSLNFLKVRFIVFIIIL